MSCSPEGFDSTAGRVSFVHVTHAAYALEFVVHGLGFLDAARVTSRLEFEMLERGRPAFDFSAPGLADALDVSCNGTATRFVAARFPETDEAFRYLDEELAPGATHVLECEHDLNTGHLHSDVLEEMDGGVRFRLRMMDVQGSVRFSGAYWPSNFEFDRFPVSLDIAVHGSDRPHRVMHNGHGDLPSAGQRFSIRFPDHFSPSFPYLDVFPQHCFSIRETSHPQAGKKGGVELVTYTRAEFDRSGLLDDFVDEAGRWLDSLEADFGPFPYDRLIVNARVGRGGGMEYAGATDTDLEFLYHELNHSYFARCISPADGNSGWMDEAIAVWCDPTRHFFDKTRTQPPAVRSNMGARSRFTRGTSGDAAGRAGAEVMGYLDHLLRDQGGLRPQLRRYYEQRQRRCTTSDDFEALLASVLPADQVKALFDRCVRGIP